MQAIYKTIILLTDPNAVGGKSDGADLSNKMQVALKSLQVLVNDVSTLHGDMSSLKTNVTAINNLARYVWCE